MNQPPQSAPNWPSPETSQEQADEAEDDTRAPQNPTASLRPPDWRRPTGVAPGTWDYVHQRTIADHYDSFVADTSIQEVERSLLEKNFPALGSGESQTIIDLGCGTGRTAIPLAKAGYEVLAIDLSVPMLEVLSKKITLNSPGSIHPIRANLVQMEGLGDNIADSAVCLFSTLGMIQGRQARRSVLTHANRMTRPGSLMLLHVHHRFAGLREPDGKAKLLRSWWASRRKGRGEESSEFGDSVYSYRGLEKMFMHRFSRRELAADLLATNWRPRRWHRLSIDGKQLTGRWPIAGGFFVEATNGK